MGTVITRSCDLCLMSVDELQELKSEFQLPHIKELCRPCIEKLDAFIVPKQKAANEEIGQAVKQYLTDKRAEA